MRIINFIFTQKKNLDKITEELELELELELEPAAGGEGGRV